MLPRSFELFNSFLSSLPVHACISYSYNFGSLLALNLCLQLVLRHLLSFLLQPGKCFRFCRIHHKRGEFWLINQILALKWCLFLLYMRICTYRQGVVLQLLHQDINLVVWRFNILFNNGSSLLRLHLA